MNTKSIIKTYLNNNISKMSSLVIFTILTIAFKIFNPICMKLIIDFSTKGDFKEYGNMVILFTVLMGVSTVLSMVFDSIRQAKTTGFGNDITVELRTMSFQTIMKSELYEVNKISNEELSETVVNSSKILGDDYTSGKLIKLLYNALYLVAMLITMMVFNPTFAILSTLSLPLFYFIYKYLSHIADKRQETYTKVNNEHQDIINDRMQQLKIIKTRNGIDKENDLYEKTLSDNKKIFARNINIINTKNKFVPSLFVGISWFVLFLITCYEVYQSQNMEWIISEIGSIIGCVALSPKVISTFKLMLDLYYTKIDTDAECEKLDKIFSLKSERRLENVPSLEEVHSLRFNNVSFDYSTYGVSDKVLLDKVEFEVKKGEKLGIIGLPGSGKTTIADLITKVIRPKVGNVLINNCDINKLNTQYLRNIVTYVPENYQLLNVSIEENVTYPLPLDEYKYNDALNKCKLKDLIFSLPQRDETNARLANLSTADIQKISLANAFYKESSIIILDDATSKLDSVTEESIMNEFYKLKNKISIVITSRINNIVKCDKILLISNGKVVEYGRVDELLSRRNSVFAKMVSEANLDKKVV